MGNLTACITNSENENNTIFSIININPTHSPSTSLTAISKSGKTEDEKLQLIWEFQRYNAELGWGGTSNFEPGDPGRWSTEDEGVFGETLQVVAPTVPAGYFIEQNWSIVVRKRKAKRPETNSNDDTSITDRFGWHYCQSFQSKIWSDVHKTGFNVRRRAWKRILRPKLTMGMSVQNI